MKQTIEEALGRIRSPFFLTFIIIWSYWNFDLYIIIYNLNSYPSVSHQISAIRNYFKHNWFSLTLIPFGYTFLSLIIYYIGTSLGLLVKEFYAAKVKNRILHILHKGEKTVSIDRYNSARSQIIDLKDEIKESETRYTYLQQRNKNVEDDNAFFRERNIDLDGKLDESQKQNEIYLSQINLFKSKEKSHFDEIEKLQLSQMERKEYDYYKRFINTQLEVSIYEIFDEGSYRIQFDSEESGIFWEISRNRVFQLVTKLDDKNTKNRTSEQVRFKHIINPLKGFYEFISETSVSKMHCQIIRVLDNSYIGYELHSNRTITLVRVDADLKLLL